MYSRKNCPASHSTACALVLRAATSLPLQTEAILVVFKSEVVTPTDLPPSMRPQPELLSSMMRTSTDSSTGLQGSKVWKRGIQCIHCKLSWAQILSMLPCQSPCGRAQVHAESIMTTLLESLRSRRGFCRMTLRTFVEQEKLMGPPCRMASTIWLSAGWACVKSALAV